MQGAGDKINRDATRDGALPGCTATDAKLDELSVKENEQFMVYLFVSLCLNLLAIGVAYRIALVRFGKATIGDLTRKMHFWVLIGVGARLADMMSDWVRGGRVCKHMTVVYT